MRQARRRKAARDAVVLAARRLAAVLDEGADCSQQLDALCRAVESLKAEDRGAPAAARHTLIVHVARFANARWVDNPEDLLHP